LLVDRAEFTHIVDRMVASSVSLDVGVTNVKWFGVLMLLKYVMYGFCISMMSQCAANKSLMSSRWVVIDLLDLSVEFLALSLHLVPYSLVSSVSCLSHECRSSLRPFGAICLGWYGSCVCLIWPLLLGRM